MGVICHNIKMCCTINSVNHKVVQLFAVKNKTVSHDNHNE